jgi:hypothetical protein
MMNQRPVAPSGARETRDEAMRGGGESDAYTSQLADEVTGALSSERIFFRLPSRVANGGQGASGEDGREWRQAAGGNGVAGGTYTGATGPGNGHAGRGG